MKPSRSRFLDVRGLPYHLREWGDADAPLLFMLHGWMDMSATFQFLVDALSSDWHVVAPDWRGFGKSGRAGDGYWFPDYLADLDRILSEYSPRQAVRLLGHSMGGNVATMYAGVRPARVAAVVSLDGFGLADRDPSEAPGRLEKWLGELRAPSGFREYESREALADRLRRDNPRLDAARAAFLAAHFGEVGEDGVVRYAADPAHRRVNPVLYRRAEVLACWRRVTAPVMWLVPEEPALRRRLGVSDADYAQARECFRDFRELAVGDTGHNMHHDQAPTVARAVEDFLVPTLAIAAGAS